MNTYTDNWKDALELYQTLPIEPNAQYFDEWNSRKRRGLDKYSDWTPWNYDPSKYVLDLKSVTKSNVYEPNKIVRGKTIHEQHKVITAYYSSIMRQAAERLINILKPTFAVDLYMDDAERAVWFEKVTGKSMLEIDMSAFDKSQDEYHLLFFLNFLKVMGVPETYIEFWRQGQCRTKSKSRNGNIIFYKDFQTNSGDASTILKNTITLMNAMAALAKSKWAIFKGDDSVVFDQEVSAEQAEDIMTSHNLEMKFKVYHTLGYYCGHFVYRNNGHWCIMKDFVKINILRIAKRVPVEHPQFAGENNLEIYLIGTNFGGFAGFVKNPSKSSKLNSRQKL